MKPSRRVFVKGLGALAALPVLRPRAAFGQAAEFPRRVVFFIQPNGTSVNHFYPAPGQSITSVQTGHTCFMVVYSTGRATPAQFLG